MSGHQPSRLGRAFAIALAAGLTGCEPAPPLPAVPRAPDGSAFEYDGCAEATSEPTRTLVLRDDAGSEPWLAELHGVAVSAVISHFGAYASKRVSRYCAGEILAYRAVVYVGSTYHQHLPGAFLEDVLSGARPVVWLGANLNDLAARPEFLSRYGFLPVAPGPLRFGQVRYKGVLLARFADSPATLAKLDVQEPGRVTTLAEAIALDGTAQPWAVRSANLTYVAENPVAYIDHDDRYLAFCDLLFDVLAPLTPARHRALVRIEDVHPLSSPVALRAIADYLHDEGVPFSVAVIPSFQDPRGTMHGGVPQARTLVEAPAVVDALAYMVARGGTLVMHGYTHQHRDLANPYSATTGADYEFFRAHVGDSGAVVMDGPLPGDTGAWALERADKGLSILPARRPPRDLRSSNTHTTRALRSTHARSRSASRWLTSESSTSRGRARTTLDTGSECLSVSRPRSLRLASHSRKSRQLHPTERGSGPRSKRGGHRADRASQPRRPRRVRELLLSPDIRRRSPAGDRPGDQGRGLHLRRRERPRRRLSALHDRPRDTVTGPACMPRRAARGRRSTGVQEDVHAPRQPP